jgi:hypothetical protein
MEINDGDITQYIRVSYAVRIFPLSTGTHKANKLEIEICMQFYSQRWNYFLYGG